MLLVRSAQASRSRDDRRRTRKMASDLTLELADQPGSLAHVGEVLGAAGINIDGICGYGTGGHDEVHILIADAKVAATALRDAGVTVGADREVEVISMVDAPGEMGRHLQRIADAGVDLDLVYLATNTRLVLGSPNPAGLRDAVHAHG
jgi:hypothetical protein